MDNKYFVEEAIKNNMDALEILNWYRNLYYKEGENTERGLMARAINSVFNMYNIKQHNLKKDRGDCFD